MLCAYRHQKKNSVEKTHLMVRKINAMLYQTLCSLLLLPSIKSKSRSCFGEENVGTKKIRTKKIQYVCVCRPSTFR